MSDGQLGLFDALDEVPAQGVEERPPIEVEPLPVEEDAGEPIAPLGSSASPAEPEPEDEPAPSDEETGQASMFGDLDEFRLDRQEWGGMPEFVQEDLAPWKSVAVHFTSRADMNAFALLVEQQMTSKTRSLWYPKAEIGRFIDKRYADEK